MVGFFGGNQRNAESKLISLQYQEAKVSSLALLLFYFIFWNFYGVLYSTGIITLPHQYSQLTAWGSWNPAWKVEEATNISWFNAELPNHQHQLSRLPSCPSMDFHGFLWTETYPAGKYTRYPLPVNLPVGTFESIIFLFPTWDMTCRWMSYSKHLQESRHILSLFFSNVF